MTAIWLCNVTHPNLDCQCLTADENTTNRESTYKIWNYLVNSAYIRLKTSKNRSCKGTLASEMKEAIKFPPPIT